jgi:hypothetical protein
VARRVSPLDVPSLAWRMLASRPEVIDHPQVASFPPAADLRVRSADGSALPLEVDGDWIGDVDEVVFGVVPGGLRVVS